MFIDVKLPPRAAFTAQIIGTLFGSLLNFGWFFSYLYPVMMILKYAFHSDNELYHRQPMEYSIVGPRN
jgi:hypothetical protein